MCSTNNNLAIVPSGNQYVADTKQTEIRTNTWPTATQNIPWDADNRLIQMQSLVGSPSKTLTYTYDTDGRWIRQAVQIGGVTTTTHKVRPWGQNHTVDTLLIRTADLLYRLVK